MGTVDLTYTGLAVGIVGDSADDRATVAHRRVLAFLVSMGQRMGQRAVDGGHGRHRFPYGCQPHGLAPRSAAPAGFHGLSGYGCISWPS